jgi:uroporphyrinogen III methyltransferase/synthase
MRSTPIPGKVYLVGAGPGDPELITCKARRLLINADCVLYDNLAAHSLLALAPPAAEKLYVGKKKSAHAFSQEEICRMLIERARAGMSVVRLKGGDPYLFGRGGEEAEALFDSGILFEVVPGVTSALGVAAYAGIPLTHREHSSAVTIITGHNPELIDWNRTTLSETLVILMGLTTFDEVARRLIASGRPAETPAAVVRWATRPDQETLSGTLATLPEMIHARKLKPPATIIVGDVAQLRAKLAWYERLPLFGRTVVVTRPREQSSGMAAQLRELGANAVELPTIEIRPARDAAALDRAIAGLAGYGWLLFTSANGVRFFLEALDRAHADARSIRGRICAIGPATRQALAAAHLQTDLMGEEYIAESLLAAFAPFDLSGQRMLLARAAVARDILPEGLAARGALVDVVEAYRTARPEDLSEHASELLASLDADDWIAFTSSSTVRNLLESIGPEPLKRIRIATIGPVTSAALRESGLQVTTEASTYTSEGVVDAIRGMA